MPFHRTYKHKIKTKTLSHTVSNEAWSSGYEFEVGVFISELDGAMCFVNKVSVTGHSYDSAEILAHEDTITAFSKRLSEVLKSDESDG